MNEEIVCTAGDGFPLAVQVGGAENAPVLLLLQGQANSHAWWNGLREGFEDNYRTVTVDYRGTGQSRGPVDQWTTAGFAADAVCVLDHLGVDAAAVYGTSMGGRVAQMLAVFRPDLVTALVLACASPGGVHAVEQASDVRRKLTAGSAEERKTVLHDLFYTPDWPCRPEKSNLLGDPTMSRQEATAHRRASSRHNAWDVLPSIQAPALVLHGEDDRMMPVDNAALLADRIPDSRVQIFPRGRHGFFEEYSTQVTPAVLDFLSSSTVQ